MLVNTFQAFSFFCEIQIAVVRSDIVNEMKSETEKEGMPGRYREKNISPGKGRDKKKVG
ncbi:MAG: hypothetical protein GX126_14505 [Bacteroidales bacterium]|nr:hypothetical protein [Bacteroidales bacterium]